jgi:hypothetical protein
MSFSLAEIRRILVDARRLSLDSPVNTVEEFVSSVLGLNAAERIEYFPGPENAEDLLADAVSHLTDARDEVLRNKCAIPTFAVYEDGLGIFHIAGLSTYLEAKDTSAAEAVLRGRLRQHVKIRKALRSLERGQHLEALAAAIMNSSCKYGEATQGSGDQGIDAIGWKDLMLVDSAFTNKLIRVRDVLPGEKVFLFVSSKATIGSEGATQSLLDPATIRELVGGWIIQRTAAGMWQRSAGIRMLSPVQMILVTTYRLSEDAKALCFDLGIQLWGIPELIYLVCKWAPDSVFEAPNGYNFSGHGFRRWWRERDRKRITPENH